MNSRRLMFWFAAALFLTGLALVLWPVLYGYAADMRSRDIVSSFVSYVAASPQSSEAQDAAPGSPESDPLCFPELWEACTDYNRHLSETSQADFNEHTISKAPFDMTEYGWTQDIFAVLYLPTISCELPLYLGTSYDRLLLGGTILGQTSLPIGGSSTNCVICGHRTWNGDDKLRDIDQIQIGDPILIRNPWETLSYQVVDIEIILPTDSDKLKIQPGRDLLSIFTCTPVHVNTHRYLLICERTYEYEVENQ